MPTLVTVLPATPLSRAAAAAAALMILLPAAVAPGSALGSGGPSPFLGARLYVDPDSNARHQADHWRRSRPGDAAAMDKIAVQPQAVWFGDWSGNIRIAVADTIRAARGAGALPVLVAYDIPKRDCGGFSAGGARSATVYRRWIRGFAAGLGQSRAAVVLEPDAVPDLECLSPAERKQRLRLISKAIATLVSDRNASVYVDAGNQSWHSPRVMASRLKAAGIRRARGFSLNVSNFFTTADEVSYGQAISARIGKPFVVDTSRNGAGPTRDHQWCNPPGRALGQTPTGHTGQPLVDAFLWIKAPGESDGQCHGGPAAGDWWPQYALGLADRAAW